MNTKILQGQPDSVALINASLQCVELMGSSVDFFRQIRENTPFNLDKFRVGGPERNAMIQMLTNTLNQNPDYSAIAPTAIRNYCNCLLDKVIERYPTRFFEALQSTEMMEPLMEECETENHLFED